MNEDLRLEGIKSIGFVDKSFIFKKDIGEVLAKVKPDIVVKGLEYASRFNPEKTFLDKNGGKLIFNSGDFNFISHDLLSKEISHISKQDFEKKKKYLKRHNISKKNIENIINKFNDLNVIVLGDIIIDEYINCSPLGMSHEDPVIVVKPLSNQEFIGGAGIVSAHASCLGANSQLVSIIGKDELGLKVVNLLSKYGVYENLIIDQNRQTTIKKRYRHGGKNLFKVSHLDQSDITIDIQKNIINKVKKLIKDCNLIIFSDFNYGALPQSLVDEIIRISKDNSVMISADTQSSSQIGDISRYKNIDLLSATEREIRISLNNNQDGLIILCDNLNKKTNSKYILLKLQSEGVIINNYTKSKVPTDKLEAFNDNPIDVAGAGDSMLVTTSMALAAGANIWEAAYIGSLASSIQVSRNGNIPLRKKDLIKYI